MADPGRDRFAAWLELQKQLAEVRGAGAEVMGFVAAHKVALRDHASALKALESRVNQQDAAMADVAEALKEAMAAFKVLQAEISATAASLRRGDTGGKR